MPSALVGTVILTLRGRGVGRSELIRRVEWLKKIIEDKGRLEQAFRFGKTAILISRDEVISNKFTSKKVIHLFVEEAIVCAALYSVVKKGGGKPLQRMQYADLLDEISFLSSLLKLDMIYRPGGVESNTRRTIQWLADNNVIEVCEDGWVGLSDMERSCGRENYGKCPCCHVSVLYV